MAAWTLHIIKRARSRYSEPDQDDATCMVALWQHGPWTQHIIDNPQETASMQAETIPKSRIECEDRDIQIDGERKAQARSARRSHTADQAATPPDLESNVTQTRAHLDCD